MKKFILYGCFVLSLAAGMAAVAWFVWNSSCSYVEKLPEGTSYTGMCAGDGMQFVGLFLLFSVIAVAYTLLLGVVLKLLGFKLTKK